MIYLFHTRSLEKTAIYFYIIITKIAHKLFTSEHKYLRIMDIKMARPKKYTKKYLKEVAILINEYVDKSAIPVLAECAFELGHHRQFFYQHDDCPEFLDAVKRLLTKKEARLEIGGLSGKLNVSMSIFSLKQLGWSDKADVTVRNDNPEGNKNAISGFVPFKGADVSEK